VPVFLVAWLFAELTLPKELFDPLLIDCYCLPIVWINWPSKNRTFDAEPVKFTVGP